MNENRKDPIRLLLVDDEAGFRAAVARRLARRGLSPMEAQSGEACIEIARKERVDVVVMDMKMPGMNGLETLKCLKKMDARIQVILLTGHAAVSDGVEGIKAGAFDYLTKPVDIDHLVGKIGQAADLIRLEDENERERQYCLALEKKMVDTERLAALGTMSTGIAHEINNPLAIINEAAGVMKQIISGPEMADCSQRAILSLAVDKIEKSVKRAGKITHQLLGHVKKQASKTVKVNLESLLRETLSLIEKDVTDKSITVTWKIDPGLAPFWSDPYQIRQVAINLFTNAVHALDRNGVLTLSVICMDPVTSSDIDEIERLDFMGVGGGSAGGDGRSKGRWQIGDAAVMLEVRDNGVGISEENLGNIFDPFFTTKSFHEGTGLGLFVVHKIVTGLGGTIDVESRVGEGSAFRIILPYDRKTIM